MQNNHKSIISQNKIVALVLILALGILIALRFDYYYDLNDDLLMKDIVAGRFTGVPDGHNIQMLYPISWLISIAYCLPGTIPWYGIFFLICHFGCLYLIAERTASYFSKLWEKCLVVLVEVLIVGAFFLYELVFVQYTVTAAILGATAAFLFYTTDQELTWQSFLKKNVISILLVILAFQIRTEMLLLISPFIGVMGICKWVKENKILCKESFLKYFLMIGAVIIGMVLSLAVNAMAYGNEEWRTFQSLFDSRTELYDFEVIPSYEDNQEFYNEIGLKESEQALFENYNYGFDSRINEQTMKQVADYAKIKKVAEQPVGTKVKQSIRTYLRYLFVDKGELSWNVLIIAAYVLALFMAVVRKEYSFFLKAILIAGVRSFLWLYIIYGERIPNRISHSLYLAELLCLMALMLELGKNRIWHVRYFPLIIVGVFALLQLTTGVQYVQKTFDARENINKEYLQLQSYMAEHADAAYLLDVYSTVAYSEKLFTGEHNALCNYDYLGGWASGSPIDKEKLCALGIDNIEKAVCEQKNVYVVSHAKRPIDWLNAYLQEQGYQKEAVVMDMVLDTKEPAFQIYQVQDIMK